MHKVKIFLQQFKYYECACMENCLIGNLVHTISLKTNFNAQYKINLELSKCHFAN